MTTTSYQEQDTTMEKESILPSNIHTLLELRRWIDAESLLSTDPSQAFEIGSHFKSLPLMTALMNQPPLWIIDSLIEANPAAVNTKNEYGMLPIRVAIRSKCSADIIKALIREAPESTQAFGVSGKTCLHLACLYCSDDIDVIDTLLTAWPQATEWRDRDGWHPLHLACFCNAQREKSTHIVKKILDTYSNAAAMPDTPEHQLPLHIAAKHHAPIETLQLLYNAYPDAVKLGTKTYGWLPLHLACTKDASIENVRFLLHCYPEGAKIHGKVCGSLPLHVASRSGCSMDILKLLVQEYPQGLAHLNKVGETPFCATDERLFMVSSPSKSHIKTLGF